MIWKVIDWIGNLSFLASTIVSWAFVILYGIRSNWRATETGRVLMWFIVTIGAILGSAIVFGLTFEESDHPIRLITRSVGYLVLCTVLIRLFIILWKSQSERKESDDSSTSRPKD